MKKVFVSKDIPEIGIEMLKEYFEVEVNHEDKTFTKQEFIEKIKDCDGVLSSLTDPIDQEVYDACPKVKIFANCAVGFNNFDIETAKERGIVITNTPDVLSDTTAETAWSLLFAVSRRIVEADRYVRDGKWKSFGMKLLLGQDIHGKTIGVIGAGRIGAQFIEKSRGFNMKVLYHNRSHNLELEDKYGAEYVELDELIRESDFISLHCPLTPETHYLIGAREIDMMKENAILINTSRGQVVDQKALIKALQEKRIFGAGLDVYEDEPNVPEELIELDNVVLLPHIGSASHETRNTMSALAATNIINVLQKGEAPVTPVY